MSKKPNSVFEHIIKLLIHCDHVLAHHKQPELPLIRLRVEYTLEAQHFNSIQFGQEFQNSVANSSDMILLRMEKRNIEKRNKCIDDDILANILDNQEVLITKININLCTFN